MDRLGAKGGLKLRAALTAVLIGASLMPPVLEARMSFDLPPQTSSRVDERARRRINAVSVPSRRVPRSVTRSGTSTRTGFISVEPTLGIASDGTAFFYPALDPERGDVEELGIGRSTDGGRTWESILPQIPHAGSMDPYMFVDGVTGRVFVLDLQVACVRLSFSDDGGSTWVPGADCGAGDTVFMDHPSAAAGPPVDSPTIGYPNIVYICWASFGEDEFGSSCAKSLNGGASFIPILGGPSISGCPGQTGHIHVAADGTVYLPYVCDGTPYLAVSTDEASSWTEIKLPRGIAKPVGVGFPGHEAAVATDSRGTLYYMWLEQNRLPYFTSSSDRGATWRKPIRVSLPSVNEANLPALSASPDGTVAIAYMGTAQSPGSPWGYWEPCLTSVGATTSECPPEPAAYERTTWHGFVAISEDAFRKPGSWYTVRANQVTDPLVRGTCGPIRCHSVADFIDVFVTTRGEIWASFVDDCIDACVEANHPMHNGGEAIIVRIP
ncbi:MAG TPA: sialidase family protein [Actinomycetota bacterium]|nr:sialidase family protein [Actinomycetota bacterium]